MAKDVKLKIDSMMVMILVFKTSREYTNYLLSAEDRYRAKGTTEGRKQNRNKLRSWKIKEIKYRQNITCWYCNQNGHFQNQCLKPVASRDKEVNMTAGYFDDALVCCVENTIEYRIMDFDASFHATYYKEELDRFRLRSDKVCLANDRTLDIASVRDVALKTSFGTSCTMKDVRYIPGLKRRLILVGQLDEKGYHVGFGDQQWKVTKGSLVVARGNKYGSLYMVEVHPEGIGTIIDASKGNVPDVRKVDIYFCKPGGLGKQKNLSFIMLEKTRKLQRLEQVHTEGYGPTLLHQSEDPTTIILLSKTTAGVAAESTGLRAEAQKMSWADSVSTAYLIYRIPYVLIGLRIPEEEWQGKDTSLAHLRIRRVTKLSEAEILHLWTRFMKPGGSSDMSAGFENNGSLEDSGISDEEYYENGASSKEGGFETPQVGDEKEVEVLCSFNWPPSELITEDGVLPE
nr:hypothetical protein [Tanacetum cinerariifolium]